MKPFARRRPLPAAVWLSLILWSACRGIPAIPGEDNVVRRGGDLVAAGRAVHVSDSIPGDVMAVGGDVGFSGSAGGDFLGAGGRQEVAGSIGGSARIAGGEVRMSATVGRNATLAGGRVDVTDPAEIAGNAYVTGGEVRVAGSVGRMLQVAGGSVGLNGTFGDVSVTADRLRVGPGAVIRGSLRHRVQPANVSIDPSARIEGEIVALPAAERRDGRAAFRFLWRLAFLLTGAVAIAVFPGLARSAAEALRSRAGLAAGLGVLWLIGAPVLVLALAMTVIGIPLALIVTAVYTASLYIGPAVLGLWLGRLIFRGRGESRSGLVGTFLVGGLIMLLATLIPYVGPAVLLLAAVAGAGALVTALVQLRPATA